MNTQRYEKCKWWLLNINYEDIDWLNKLDNLSEELNVSEKDYELLKEDGQIVLEIMKLEIEKQIDKYVEDVIELTDECVGWGSCEEDDWSSGLYNHDSLYLLAINKYLKVEV